MNCHVTFLAVVEVSRAVAVFTLVVTDGAATGSVSVAAKLVVTSAAIVSLSLLVWSSCLSSASGSGISSYKSQSVSTGGRLDRAAPEDLLPEAEVLEGRLGSLSDRSESQSLSPATEPQPCTDTSTGPESELSESDSLIKTSHTQYMTNYSCVD